MRPNYPDTRALEAERAIRQVSSQGRSRIEAITGRHGSRNLFRSKPGLDDCVASRAFQSSPRSTAGDHNYPAMPARPSSLLRQPTSSAPPSLTTSPSHALTEGRALELTEALPTAGRLAAAADPERRRTGRHGSGARAPRAARALHQAERLTTELGRVLRWTAHTGLLPPGSPPESGVHANGATPPRTMQVPRREASTTPPRSIPEDRVGNSLGGVTVHLIWNMHVQVAGDPDVRVTEAIAHDLDGDPRGEGSSRVRVPEVVKANVGQACVG